MKLLFSIILMIPSVAVDVVKKEPKNHSANMTSLYLRAVPTSFYDFCTYATDNVVCSGQCRRQGYCAKMGYGSAAMSREERHFLKMELNFRRQIIAAGTGFYPSADFMHILEWDNECEYIARCWINLCNLDARPMFGSTTNPVGYVRYYMVYDSNVIQNRLGWYEYRKAISYWYQEAIHNRFSTLPKYFLQGPYYHDRYLGALEFAQLAWRATSLFGCSKGAQSPESGLIIEIFICVFNPAGLEEGVPVYTIGKQNCTTSNKIFNLCGYDRRLDDFLPPADAHAINEKPKSTATTLLSKKICFMTLILTIFMF